MDFFDAVDQRYSHKEDFLPDAVPLEDLQKIGCAGLAAPNGVNRQLVRLVILPDRAAVQKMCTITPARGLETAPAALAVLTTDETPPDRVNFAKEDYSAAVTQMLLAVTALGYASLWLDSPYFDAEKQKRAKELLGAPDAYHLWAVLPVGKPDGAGSRREKMPAGERMFIGQYRQ